MLRPRSSTNLSLAMMLRSSCECFLPEQNYLRSCSCARLRLIFWMYYWLLASRWWSTFYSFCLRRVMRLDMDSTEGSQPRSLNSISVVDSDIFCMVVNTLISVSEEVFLRRSESGCLWFSRSLLMTDRTSCSVSFWVKSSSTTDSQTLFIILLKKLIGDLQLYQFCIIIYEGKMECQFLQEFGHVMGARMFVSFQWIIYMYAMLNQMVCLCARLKYYQIISYNGNITNYNNFMNLAIFLHNNKEDKESVLPLPLAPVYCLPEHRWYFSSPSFVPLRKRRQNASFHKYLQSFECLGEQRKDSNNGRQNMERSLLCLFERRDYLSVRMRHVFDAIWMSCRSEVALKERVGCGCSDEMEEEGVKAFRINTGELNGFLALSKKNLSEDCSKAIEQHTNWSEFSRLIVKEKTGISCAKESELYFYRLPVGGVQQKQPLIFSLLWNDNFIVFNNGNDLCVNQHMKGKAVELSDMVRRKLQKEMEGRFEREMERVVEEIADHKAFLERGKSILRINSFRLWFYKKEENNEIYVIGLSQLTFKGVECMLYKNINFKGSGSQRVDYNEELDSLKVNQEVMERDFLNIKCRVRELSLNNKINIPTRTLISSNSNRIRIMSQMNKQSNREQRQQENRAKEEECRKELSQIQCASCKNLLLTNEVPNEITAKHIKEIRYLRQAKIGKQQFDDYQFVKICSLCYQIYLKHYKNINNMKNKSREKKTMSFYQHKQKQGLSLKGEQSLNLVLKDSKGTENENKLNTLVFKGLSKGVSEKIRAKSELNTSKQQCQLGEKLSVKKYYNVVGKMKNPPLLGSMKNKKTKTNHTTNTQTIDHELAKIKTIREQIQMERTFTQNDKTSLDPNESKSLPKSQSFKWKGSMLSKNGNIVSKMNAKADLIDRQTQSKSNYNDHLKQEKQSENGAFSKDIHGEILINAIQQYENISRPSFKRLVYKNHKNCIRKEVNLNLTLEDSVDDLRSIHWKKRSIHSFNQQ